MDISEMLYKSTVFIQNSDYPDQNGTGFLFRFNNILGQAVDVIVTNKHVAEACKNYTFYFQSTVKDETEAIECSFQECEWLFHSSADLAICLLSHIVELCNSDKPNLLIIPFTTDNIPTQDYVNNMSCIDDVLMVGYPSGVYDAANNLPMMRRGITATPYKYDFNDQPEFMIDAGMFKGSSGSPICSAQPIPDDTLLENRQHYPLLGIVYMVQMFPIAKLNGTALTVPNGLGNAIKSRCLLDFIPELEERIKFRNIRNQGTDIPVHCGN